MLWFRAGILTCPRTSGRNTPAKMHPNRRLVTLSADLNLLCMSGSPQPAERATLEGILTVRDRPDLGGTTAPWSAGSWRPGSPATYAAYRPFGNPVSGRPRHATLSDSAEDYTVDLWRFPHHIAMRCGKRHESTSDSRSYNGRTHPGRQR